MKKTKQQIIDELKKELEISRKNLQLSVGTFHDRDERLNKILCPDRIYSIANMKNFDQLCDEIVALKTKVSTEGGLLPYIDHTIREENAKLWYLVRVTLKDPLIKEPFDMQRQESRFNSPNFN